MKRKYSQEEVDRSMSGRIYINTDDLNIFLKRKRLCAWTMNWGNKWTWVIAGAGLLVIAVILWLAG